MLTPGEGQIRALVTVAGNPVLSTPNGRQLEQALDQTENTRNYWSFRTQYVLKVLARMCTR